jgi:uncharacterized damage-inducible protein DinB
MATDPALEMLRDLFRHHAWATADLMDYCAQLTPEQLSGSVPGTRGPIVETLEHLVAADQRYKRRFGLRADEPVLEGDGPSLQDMRRIFANEGERWQSVLGRLGDFDITVPANPQDDPPWPEARHANNLLLLQALQHGNDHRTQICTIIGAMGLDAPNLDGWMYWRAERLLKKVAQ